MRQGKAVTKHAEVYVAREEFDEEESEFISIRSIARPNAVTGTRGERVGTVIPDRIRVEPADIPDQVFHQDTSLIHCWNAALTEFKSAHPARFAPITSRPPTAISKHAASPLWYGPLVPVVHDLKRKGESLEEQETKRLKAEKKHRKNVERRRAQEVTRAISPSWTPQSPTHQRSLSPDLSSTTPSYSAPPHFSLPAHLMPAPHRASSSSSSAPSATVSPAPSLIPPAPSPSISSLPPHPLTNGSSRRRTFYPPPPPMVDLEPGTSVTNDATVDELLQSALWSWYNVGYQTGVYHAAIEAARRRQE